MALSGLQDGADGADGAARPARPAPPNRPVLSGIGYRRVHHDALLAAAPDLAPDVLELIPGHLQTSPDRLAALAARYPIVFHDVLLSIGTVGAAADALAATLLDRVAALVAIAPPVLFSEHLALTRSPAGVDLGHLCPIPYTHEALAHVTARTRAWQAALGVPVALENIALPFELPGDMPESEFFHRLVDATDCGMLLDLTNLVVNARNLGFDAAERLQAYPLEAVWQVHLAGARRHHALWVDSHDDAVDDEAYALLRELRSRARALRVIIVERDANIPELPLLTAEARHAKSLWETA